MPVVKSSRSILRKNSAGSDFERRRVNLIEGTNVTLTVADDTTNNEVDVTVAATGGSPPFVDTTSLVEGSVDATKEIRFEVDGLTTGTVRVITPPNADFTMAGINIAQTFSADQTFTGAETAIAASGTFTNSAGEKILVDLTPTSQAGVSGNPVAIKATMGAGYTGGSYNYTIWGNNLAAGVGTGTFGSGGSYNAGTFGQVNVVTVGHNVGAAGWADGSSVRNIGTLGVGVGGVGDRIGVLGSALSGGAIDIGVYAYIGSTAPTLTSAALIANNGASTNPIFLAQDNGSTILLAADAGKVAHFPGGGAAVDATYQHYLQYAVGGAGGLKIENTSAVADAQARLQLVNNAGTGGSLFISSSTSSAAGYSGPSWLSLYTGSPKITIAVQNASGQIDFLTGTTPTLMFRMREDGAPQWQDAGTKPACSATLRGSVWYDAGAATVLDTFELCRKAADDTYAWVSLI